MSNWYKVDIFLISIHHCQILYVDDSQPEAVVPQAHIHFCCEKILDYKKLKWLFVFLQKKIQILSQL